MKKNEKGSISLYVLIAMLFFLIFAVTTFVMISNARTSQLKAMGRVKEVYEEDIGKEKDIYDSLVEPPVPFQYIMAIPETNKTYTINLPTQTVSGQPAFQYNFTVDWGDGTTSTVTSQADTDKTHTYAQAGGYTVSITGVAEGAIKFENEKRLKELLTGYPKSMKVTQTSFSSFFYNCTNLTGSIPEGLFANTPNVTSFNSTFDHCINLTGSIPENLFKNTPNVTSFSGAFFQCNSLTRSIPENLFKNTPNVTSFDDTFNSCSGLTGSIPENLFKNTPNVTSFNGTFNACSGLTGNAPALWERTNVNSSYNCFGGCTNLSNYSSIPSGWK